MNLRDEILLARTRRQFFRDCGVGLGSVALASLLNERLFAEPERSDELAPKKPHFPAKVKNVIYLHMAGSPSGLGLFDYKPKLNQLHGKPWPEPCIVGHQFAVMNGVPRMVCSR